jgi:peptidoglycan/LPS O-acetylase OafA/YrhL
MLQILFGIGNVPPNSWQLFLSNIAALICTYALAKASWKYFEAPLLRRGHAYQY